MGLDIVSYSSVEFVHGEPHPHGRDDCDHLANLYVGDFPDRADGMTPGCYRFRGQLHFCAGSYSGYNAWRNTLSLVAMGAPASEVWAEDSYVSKFKQWRRALHFAARDGFVSFR